MVSSSSRFRRRSSLDNCRSSINSISSDRFLNMADLQQHRFHGQARSKSETQHALILIFGLKLRQQFLEYKQYRYGTHIPEFAQYRISKPVIMFGNAQFLFNGFQNFTAAWMNRKPFYFIQFQF